MCGCERDPVDEHGAAAALVARLALKALDRARREDGGGPVLPEGFAAVVEHLLAAAGSASAPALGRISIGERMTVSEAAGRLGVSPSHTRRLAASGALAGARRQGRDWLIPADSVTDYRRSRNAAA